jgi:hypothetical protein
MTRNYKLRAWRGGAAERCAELGMRSFAFLRNAAAFTVAVSLLACSHPTDKAISAFAGANSRRARQIFKWRLTTRRLL